ncbi:transposase [Streptomyces sp. NBC_01298]|uniref:transposase n=1 Tax=Streptomyces sp. NBC_01298 TaxID=2903817 RepID=UPI002E101086|nr:transposase [Streptomyces sp. NBC_01298]
MEMVRQLVPDSLWELFLRVMPEAPVRPQGGGRRRADDRGVLAAILFVATSGCTCRQLPPRFGASWQTAHRRFTHWTEARVWAKLHRIILDELGATGELDWSRCAIDSVSGRHRWVVERTVSWLAGCRRLHRRYERKAEHFLAFVGIAATLICHRRLTN